MGRVKNIVGTGENAGYHRVVKSRDCVVNSKLTVYRKYLSKMYSNTRGPYFLTIH